MTVADKIKEDGIGMKWLRTAATTVSSIAAALVLIWGGLVWLVEPRLREWATELVDGATEDLRKEFKSSEEQIERLNDVVKALEDNIVLLTENVVRSTAPAWRFDPVETNISDGPLGGKVVVTSAGFQLRDCGIPVVDLYFVDIEGTYHRFEDASILTENNRGIALPVEPGRMQDVAYTAVIPNNDYVTAGRGQGYISVVFPDKCPLLTPVIAGPLQFRIHPERDQNGTSTPANN